MVQFGHFLLNFFNQTNVFSSKLKLWIRMVYFVNVIVRLFHSEKFNEKYQNVSIFKNQDQIETKKLENQFDIFERKNRPQK